MLLQSADGAVHLLPALPDAWPSGSVRGLRARGGFEILNMQWKNSKLIKVVVKSIIGGNLRLRVPNAMKLTTGFALKKSSGNNSNPFYQVEEIPAPIISEKASITPLEVKETLLYDLPTQPGKMYTLIFDSK
jgi:alpha-L-fucosidase 2